MSVNGSEVGESKTSHKSYLPLEVEVTPGRTPQSATPGFSLAQISKRVPSSSVVGDPLVRGTLTPGKFREAYREIRFGLEQLRDRQGVRTIGIVSVADGEGKSLTAANLALTLTEGGRRRVALIDANFDSPKIAKLLDADAPVGLAEVLAGKVPVEQAMFAAETKGLYAMSAGNLDAAGLDPLDVAETFGTLANRLATVFDYVIVDTPALSKQVDAAAVASRLDGVVMVVRAGKTTSKQVDQAVAKLGENRVLGLVLNRV